MIYFQLFKEFFKIGIFSFGGGYATIPFLFYISERYCWFSPEDLARMTAIASITPGPVGINAATYAGIKSAGILGAVIATFAEILPSFFLVIIVSKLLTKFSDNFYVKSVLDSLKPISCALLVSVALGLLKSSICSVKYLMLFLILLLMSLKSKKDPAFYMLIGGIIGAVLTFI